MGLSNLVLSLVTTEKRKLPSQFWQNFNKPETGFVLSWKLFALWFSSCQCFHCSANGPWQREVVLSNTTKNDNFLDNSSQNFNKNRKNYNLTNWLCHTIVGRVLPFQFLILLQYQISITMYLEIVYHNYQ